MGPTSYNLASRSLMSSNTPIQIERKPKRRSKLRIVEEIHGMQKRHLSTAVFQKKIVVFKYMGITPPKVFTHCDKNICLAGLLPSISLEASEETIRKEICEVFHSCCSPDLSAIQPGDFEFIGISGKQASVPQCKNGFKWDGHAVKELAGSGSVYVRLIEDSVYPQSDDDLPPGPCTILSNSQGTDAAVVDHEERNEDFRSSGLSSDVNGSNANSIINLDSDKELSISSSSVTGPRSASNITESIFSQDLVALTMSPTLPTFYKPLLLPHYISVTLLQALLALLEALLMSPLQALPMLFLLLLV